MFLRIKNFFFKNTNTKQTIVKNTFWLLASEVISRLMRMAFIVYAARILGASGWGTFSYALSIGSIFMIFSDIGTGDLLTRELSQKKEGNTTFVSSIVFIKIIILMISIFLLFFFGPHISHIDEAKQLIPIIALIFFFDTLRNLAFSINRAYEKMEVEMASKIVMSLLVIISGVILLKIGLNSKAIAIAYAIGSGAGFIVIALMIRDHTRNLFSKINKKELRAVLKIISPFIIVTIFTTIIANADIFMLGIWKNATEIGLYTSVQRLQQFALIIPSMIATATFPFMAQLAKNSIEQFKISLEKTITTVMAIGIPIALMGILLSDQIVPFVFGAGYLGAVPVLSILMSIIFVYFPLLILSNAVFAFDKQKYLAIAYAIGVTLNIVLNIILIPKYGAIGAAIAILVSNIAITFFLWQKMKKITGFEIFPKLYKIFLSSVFMIFIILMIKYLGINIIINLILSSLIYTAFLILLKEPTILEIRKIIKI